MRAGYIAPFKGKQRHLARANPRCRAAQPDPRWRRDDSRLRCPVQGQGKDGSIVVALEMDPQQMGLARKRTDRCAD